MHMLLALCVFGLGAATATATSSKGPRQIRTFAKLTAPTSLNHGALPRESFSLPLPSIEVDRGPSLSCRLSYPLTHVAHFTTAEVKVPAGTLPGQQILVKSVRRPSSRSSLWSALFFV